VPQRLAVSNKIDDAFLEMDEEMAIYFGICPEPDGHCPHSYTRFKTLSDGFTMWFSSAAMPDCGGPQSAPRNPELRAACSQAFYPSAEQSGFCGSCGRPLLFALPAIDLGACPGCGRDYNQGDLIATFCHKCGVPIEINEPKKSAYARDTWLRKLFELTPSLQEFGYLPTSIGK
jgi:predicted amidophosphoribosyltransferase